MKRENHEKANSSQSSEAKLGRGFNILWSAAIATNMADGLARTAAVLIAATLSRDPFLVSMISALGMLPWLLFAIPAGGVIDRYDRRKIMAISNILRTALLFFAVALIAFGQLTIWWLYIIVLLFGVGEVFADNANNAIVPQLVGRKKLFRANSRIQGAQVAVDTFVATPISGLLFAVLMSLPLAIAGLGYLASVILVLMLPLAVARPSDQQHNAQQKPQVSAREGFRFIWNHRYLRLMTVMTCLTGFFFAMSNATAVLYFLQLGVPEAYIGFAVTTIGVGALLGAVIASRLIHRFGVGQVMWLGLSLGAITMIPVALFQNLASVLIFFAFCSFGVSLWNVGWGSMRQMVTPERLQGRVFGINRTFIWGIQPLGTLIGGALGWITLTTPILIGAIGSTIVVALFAKIVLSSTTLAEEHNTETGSIAIPEPAPGS